MSGAEGSAPREAAIDTGRIAAYFGATGAEVLIISAVMFAVQTVGALLPPVGYKILACVFFAAMSLKSRVFAILDASRPEVGSSMPVETKRPAWTPPGPVFPIVWSTIGILRTVSSMLVWEACGRQMLVLPLIAIMSVIYLYHQTLPLAGMVLAPSGLWLSIASFLIYSIWRLNGSDPIRPRKETLA
jgi:tryptophan-rich sensory protein